MASCLDGQATRYCKIAGMPCNQVLSAGWNDKLPQVILASWTVKQPGSISWLTGKYEMLRIVLHNLLQHFSSRIGILNYYK